MSSYPGQQRTRYDRDRLTRDDLDRMEGDDRWLGFGYIGERRNHRALSREAVAYTDTEVLTRANDAGMSYDELFAWANSKDGRWFADMTFGSATGHYVTRTFAQAAQYAPRRTRQAVQS